MINLNFNPVKLAYQPQKNFNEKTVLDKRLKADTICFKSSIEDKKIDNDLSKVVEALKNAENLAIITHMGPDGDAISSAAAALLMAKKLPNIKKVQVLLSGATPKEFQHLKGTEDFVNITKENPALDYKGNFDTVLMLDCGDAKRLSYAKEVLESASTKLKVDHHHNDIEIADASAVDPKAASTTELLIKLADKLNIDLKENKEIAEDLYTGLLTDTGGFRYLEQPEKSFKNASILSATGINTGDLYQKAMDFIPKNLIPLYKKLWSDLKFSDNGKIAYIKADVNDPDIAVNKEGATNAIKSLTSQFCNIEDVEVSMSLKQTEKNPEENQLKGLSKEQSYHTGISLRSNGLNVQEVCSKNLDGGGHPKASGGHLSGSPEDNVPKLIGIINKALEAKASS